MKKYLFTSRSVHNCIINSVPFRLEVKDSTHRGMFVADYLDVRLCQNDYILCHTLQGIRLGIITSCEFDGAWIVNIIPTEGEDIVDEEITNVMIYSSEILCLMTEAI